MVQSSPLAAAVGNQPEKWRRVLLARSDWRVVLGGSTCRGFSVPQSWALWTRAWSSGADPPGTSQQAMPRTRAAARPSQKAEPRLNELNGSKMLFLAVKKNATARMYN
jgi:hypothetical protein